jgi:hypothetical protein
MAQAHAIGIHPHLLPHTQQVGLQLGGVCVNGRWGLLDQVLWGRHRDQQLLTLLRSLSKPLGTTQRKPAASQPTHQNHQAYYQWALGAHLP